MTPSPCSCRHSACHLLLIFHVAAKKKFCQIILLKNSLGRCQIWPKENDFACLWLYGVTLFVSRSTKDSRGGSFLLANANMGRGGGTHKAASILPRAASSGLKQPQPSQSSLSPLRAASASYLCRMHPIPKDHTLPSIRPRNNWQ